MTAALSLSRVLPAAAVAEWTTPLTLEVPDGSFYVMRTTSARSYALFRLCVGLTSPGEGRVHVLGTEPATLGRRGAQVFRRALGVGLLPHGLISNLTLRLNVVVPLVYGGLYRPVEAARDLTQGFFSELIRDRSFRRAEREKGRFRSFLLGALKHFVADARENCRVTRCGAN